MAADVDISFRIEFVGGLNCNIYELAEREFASRKHIRSLQKNFVNRVRVVGVRHGSLNRIGDMTKFG